jgi:hypothetical protein
MAVRPDDRYQSVRELRQDLMIARRLSLSHRTRRGAELVWSSLLPHKWLTLLVLTLLLLALTMTAVRPDPLF